MADIVTLAETKTWLQQESIAFNDGFLNLTIPLVSETIERIAGPVVITAYTEFLDGGFANFIVEQTPITSVTQVVPEQGTGTALDSADYDFEPDTGFIYRADFEPWLAQRRYWQIDYSAGYAAIPGQLKLAAFMLLAKYLEQKDPNVLSQKVGDWAVSNDSDLKLLAMTLEPFVEVGVVV